MRTNLLTFSLIITLAATACNNAENASETTTTDTTTAPAADATAETAPPMDSAAMAKAWEAYMTPGDMHKWMASTDGNWSGDVQSWMSPDAPATTSTASMSSKTIMGGRYQESAFTGNMMGMPFEGKSTLAYDNSKKEFVNTWIDNMGTGIMILKGKMDEATKTINFEGEMTDFTNGKDTKVRQVVKFPDANTQTMEMYCDQNGKEMKTMEMKMVRK